MNTELRNRIARAAIDTLTNRTELEILILDAYHAGASLREIADATGPAGTTTRISKSGIDKIIKRNLPAATVPATGDSAEATVPASALEPTNNHQ